MTIHPLHRALPSTALGLAACLAACLALLLGGCASAKKEHPTLPEKFGSGETYSRLMPATAAQSCEAARRALLSQGYLMVNATADVMDGKKSFQPSLETHQEVLIRVVCAPEGAAQERVSLVFVTAVQDTYSLKKTNNSASLGLGGIGSVSLPFASSNEALVKVGSETISSDTFYDSFFDVVRRYLSDDDTAAQPN